MRAEEKKNAEIRDIDSEAFQNLFRRFLEHLEDEHEINSKQINRFLGKAREPRIPASIFNKKIGSLEAISKYLVENEKKKKSEIAKLLNRDVKTIWASYENAKKKLPAKLKINDKEEITIPVSEFRNREFSVLEIITSYLREQYGLSFRQMAKITERSPGTLGTVYFRTKKKRRDIEKKRRTENTN